MERFKPSQDFPLWAGPNVLVVLCVLLFATLGVRLWYLQVVKGDVYHDKAQENRIRQRVLYAPRGVIRDALGTLVAENVPAYAVAVVREECPDINATLDQIAWWTGEDRQWLQKSFEQGKRRTKSFEEQVVVPNIPFEVVARIESERHHWPGVSVVVRPKRFYPTGSLLAHVLGYVARANDKELAQDPELLLGDNVGKLGVELALERRLRGRKGLEEFEVDATGRELGSHRLYDPVAGEDLHLALQLPLQRAGVRALAGKAGAVVVLDADTGHVLAMVSSPSYDPNEFVTGISQERWNALIDDPLHPMQNRPIQSAYPPGSVFKLVMAGAGLSTGAITPSTTVYCNGKYSVGNREYRCWRRGGHGKVDLRKSIRESCDVYYYALGERLGADAISDFARRCGLGEVTGVDLPHERSGLVPSPAWKQERFGRKWVGGDTINMSIGQGYVVTTPVQIARLVAALVNGGRVLRPLLLASDMPEEQGRLPMSDATRRLITDAMVAVVQEEGGTARVVARPGIRVGAKTGTAQVVKLMERYEKKETQEIPYKYRDHAWLAAFAEKDGRRYAVVAFVEHGGHGGSEAGPVVGAMLDALFGLGEAP
ncbi:MAG: penicillin-binding protein 2 [Desulfomicrobiaceae bacterium]